MSGCTATHTRRARRLAPVVALSIAALAWLAACQTGALPRKMRTALDEQLEALAGEPHEYQIVSAQEAFADRSVLPIDLFPQPSEAGRCPPDTGPKATWCVVIAPPLIDDAGVRFSHFVLRQQGYYLDVERLGDEEADVFAAAGCDNWETVQ